MEEAANVTARSIFDRCGNEIVRIALHDIMIDGHVTSKFMLVYTQYPLVDMYTKRLTQEAGGRYQGVDYQIYARQLLLPWNESYGLIEWLTKNPDKFSITHTSSGKQMLPTHWADQMLEVNIMIVPGCGFPRNDFAFFGRIDMWDSDETRRALMIAFDIYEEAYRGRDGKNTSAIIGDRQGLRFFSPTHMKFKD